VDDEVGGGECNLGGSILAGDNSVRSPRFENDCPLGLARIERSKLGEPELIPPGRMAEGEVWYCPNAEKS